MELTVGINSYVTLQEIKDLCLDKEILALPDPDLSFLSRRAFQWLESNYTVFQYSKYENTQTANFPLEIHENGIIPHDIKEVQILAMSLLYKQGKQEEKTVTSISVEGMSKTYQVSGKAEKEQGELEGMIKSIMKKYMVNFL